ESVARRLEVPDDAVLDVQGRCPEDGDSRLADALAVDDQAAQGDDVAHAGIDVDPADTQDARLAGSIVADVDRFVDVERLEARIVARGQHPDLAAGGDVEVGLLEGPAWERGGAADVAVAARVRDPDLARRRLGWRGDG